MAKKSLIAKEHKKLQLVKRYRAKRDMLRKMCKDPAIKGREKLMLQFKLQKLPIRSSPSRLKSRCFVTGRAKAVLRKFGLARSQFREQALQGNIPGIKKASW